MPNPRFKTNKKKRNPLLYVIPALIGVAFIILFGFYLFTVFALPSAFGQCVAVVNVEGPIMTQSVPSTLFSDSVAGSGEIAYTISSLNERDDVGAVLMVVNSPGGSVVASREIYSAVESLEKPVVVYFKEVAASGGYYISAPADYIISEPYAITGSIGVITSTFEASELYDNLGLNFTTITSGDNKDIGTDTKPLSDEQKEIFQEMIDLVFEDFKSIVVENRRNKLNSELFEEVLDGRIVLGIQAKEIGLVDEVGTRDDAIEKASELAELGEDPRVCRIDLSSGQAGLFDATSFVRSILVSMNDYGLKYSIR